MAIKKWADFINPLIPVGEKLEIYLRDKNDYPLKMEMYKHLFSVISQSYFGLLYTDDEYPMFWPMVNFAFNTLAPNPDDSYRFAQLNDKGSYKISGFRGTVKILSFSIVSGTFFNRGFGGFGPTLSDKHIDSFDIDDDGFFEILVSENRPDGYLGNWCQLSEGATGGIFRNRSYDWVNEVDAKLAIERLDVPINKPRISTEFIEERLAEISGWAEKNTKWSIDVVNQYRKNGFVNKLCMHDYSDDGGLTTQIYMDGLFDISDDEALIIETELPKECLYWNFQLADELYSTIDWINRQTTINGHTAKLDSDGKFRAVVSS